MNYAIIYTRAAADAHYIDHWEQEQKCLDHLQLTIPDEEVVVAIRENNCDPDIGQSALAVAKGMIAGGGVTALAVVDLALLSSDLDELARFLETLSRHQVRLVTSGGELGVTLGVDDPLRATRAGAGPLTPAADLM